MSHLFTRATWKLTIRESCGWVWSLTSNGCPKFGSYTKLNNPHLILCRTRSVGGSRVSKKLRTLCRRYRFLFLLLAAYGHVCTYTQPLKDKGTALTFDNRCRLNTPSANIYVCLHMHIFATPNSRICVHHTTCIGATLTDTNSLYKDYFN